MRRSATFGDTKQADLGVSLEAQTAKIRAMAVVRNGPRHVAIDAGESAKSLNRPGMARLLVWWMRARWTVSHRQAGPPGGFSRGRPVPEAIRAPRHLASVSVADSLSHTRSAAGRLVLDIMVSVSQWERAIGERTRDRPCTERELESQVLAKVAAWRATCARKRRKRGWCSGSC